MRYLSMPDPEFRCYACNQTFVMPRLKMIAQSLNGGGPVFCSKCETKGNENAKSVSQV